MYNHQKGTIECMLPGAPVPRSGVIHDVVWAEGNRSPAGGRTAPAAMAGRRIEGGKLCAGSPASI